VNDPVAAPVRWGIITALAALAFVRAPAAPWVLHIAILGLAGLSLLPMVGWLRTLWFAPVVSAAMGAWAAAELLHHGQAVTMAFAAATIAGGLVGGPLAWATQRLRPTMRPWATLLVAATVWSVILPRVTNVPTERPLLFGIDLAADRPAAIMALLLLAAGVWVVTNLAASRAGREIAAAGASPAMAVRLGASLPDVWLRAGIVSGVLAGWVGLLTTVDLQGLPAVAQFSPAIAIAWLAIPLLGGAEWATGALIGAVLIGGLPPLLHLGEPVVAAAALIAGALLQGRGLVGELARRRWSS
jgi:ABC-type branched-subunit amino acid transport system permease subunit